MSDTCHTCGGNNDNPGPNAICIACAYEVATHRNFARDCDNKIITVENGRIVRLQELPMSKRLR